MRFFAAASALAHAQAFTANASLGFDGHHRTTMRGMRRRHALAITVLAGSLIAVSAPSSALASTDSSEPAASSYIAVIDGGSSGTRLALYESSTGVTVTETFRAPTRTAGLSSFAGDPAAAGPTAIAPLLSDLSSHLEAEGIAWSDVPVALLATAGMRRLREQDPAAVRQIFASTRATIIASGFPVRANRILPDYQEALLAWLDANVAAGTLDRPRADIGIVEVGGASAQVAFRTRSASIPGAATVRVDGRDFHVVAVSYLGLGANESRDAMQTLTDGGSFCFPNNASGVDPEFYLAASTYPVKSNAALFRGSPCGRSYTDVVRDVARLSERPARPRNLAVLPGFARASFVGVGTIPAIYSDFQIPADADEQAALQRALRTTCKGVNAWPVVRALRPGPTSVITESLCSTGSYLGQFLFGPTGVGMDPVRFAAQPDLPGGEPSWPQGYAITALHP